MVNITGKAEAKLLKSGTPGIKVKTPQSLVNGEGERKDWSCESITENSPLKNTWHHWTTGHRTHLIKVT